MLRGLRAPNPKVWPIFGPKSKIKWVLRSPSRTLWVNKYLSFYTPHENGKIYVNLFYYFYLRSNQKIPLFIFKTYTHRKTILNYREISKLKILTATGFKLNESVIQWPQFFKNYLQARKLLKRLILKSKVLKLFSSWHLTFTHQMVWRQGQKYERNGLTLTGY